ncbi:Hypothetical predicted protein [Cloeon dipterum]|uniref:C-type lectin domain-containing protein n=1 Tax=Cloeon dipterum TaxID=197152 RepID=A0A8S1D0F3_9INSE|nr:Hypothetical predicted protein [Cloeon dipterum]
MASGRVRRESYESFRRRGRRQSDAESCSIYARLNSRTLIAIFVDSKVHERLNFALDEHQQLYIKRGRSVLLASFYLQLFAHRFSGKMNFVWVAFLVFLPAFETTNRTACLPEGSIRDVVTLGNGKSYHLSTEMKNWYQAKDYCVAKGMRLASPKTQEELNVLHGKIKDIEDGHVWLSASDVGRKGIEFRWLDGEVLPVNSSLWAKERKQPDHFGDGQEACAFISKYTDTNKLLDHECRTSKMNVVWVIFLVFLPAFETTNRTACLPEGSIREFVKFWGKYEAECDRCQGGQCQEEDTRSRNDSTCDIQEIKLQVETSLDNFKIELINFKDEMRQLVRNLTSKLQLSTEKEEKNVTSCLEKYKQDVVTLGNGKSYHLSTGKKNWYQAKDYCEEKGMRLASPKTQEELNILHGKISEYVEANFFWLSASDVGRKGIEFRWLDGEVLPVSSSLWDKGMIQPDSFGRGQEVCTFISKYSGTNKLADHECRTSALAGSICEALDCV